jgi:hypothetical protein
MTLAETMVAAIISSVLFLGLFTGINFVRQLVLNARYHNEAEALAMDQTLMMFNLPYTNLTSYTAVITNTVPSDSMLYPLGGTIRTAVLTYSNFCQIQVRVDWKFIKWGSTNSPSERLWVNRYQTLRGSL